MNLLEFVAATLSPEDAANEVYLRAAFEILDRNDHDGITTEDLKGMSIVACFRELFGRSSNVLTLPMRWRF